MVIEPRRYEPDLSPEAREQERIRRVERTLGRPAGWYASLSADARELADKVDEIHARVTAAEKPMNELIVRIGLNHDLQNARIVHRLTAALGPAHDFHGTAGENRWRAWSAALPKTEAMKRCDAMYERVKSSPGYIVLSSAEYIDLLGGVEAAPAAAEYITARAPEPPEPPMAEGSYKGCIGQVHIYVADAPAGVPIYSRGERVGTA